jgi:hypothetical protein
MEKKFEEQVTKTVSNGLKPTDDQSSFNLENLLNLNEEDLKNWMEKIDDCCQDFSI